MDFAGGSLKLKGTDVSIKKKKKKSKKEKGKLSQALSSTTTTTTTSTTKSKSPEPFIPRQKTEAELKFEEMQRKRQQDRISKVAAQSHKERVAEFNKYLENLSEHYDIPKVGPG